MPAWTQQRPTSGQRPGILGWGSKGLEGPLSPPPSAPQPCVSPGCSRPLASAQPGDKAPSAPDARAACVSGLLGPAPPHFGQLSLPRPLAASWHHTLPRTAPQSPLGWRSYPEAALALHCNSALKHHGSQPPRAKDGHCSASKSERQKERGTETHFPFTGSFGAGPGRSQEWELHLSPTGVAGPPAREPS